MNARIEAGVDHLLYRLDLGEPPCFGDGEGKQTKQRGAAGERLADGLNDSELLTAGQNKAAGPRVLVHPCLDVGDELRRPLNLIDDGAVAALAEKAKRVFDGELTGVGLLEIEVGEIGKGRSAQGCLSRLPGPSDGNDRILLIQGFENRLDFSLDHDSTLSEICAN